MQRSNTNTASKTPKIRNGLSRSSSQSALFSSVGCGLSGDDSHGEAAGQHDCHRVVAGGAPASEVSFGAIDWINRAKGNLAAVSLGSDVVLVNYLTSKVDSIQTF